MKKILKKFWGVAFVVVLLSSLFVAAPQAAAGAQSFSYATLPSDPTGITANGTETLDFAVAPTNHAVIYAATSDGALKSIDQGRTWVHLWTGNATTDNATALVCVAPDDENVVAYASNTGNLTPAGGKQLKISLNGGYSFFDLGTPENLAHGQVTQIYDIDISEEFTDLYGYTYRYVGVAGIAAGGGAAFYYCKVGAWSPFEWRDAVVDAPITGLGYAGADVCFFAVKFSPAFGLDNIVYLLAWDSVNNRVELHVCSLNIEGRFDAQVSGYSWYAQLGVGQGTLVCALTSTPAKGQIIFDPAYAGVYYDPYYRTAYCSVATYQPAPGGGAFRVTEDANGIPAFTAAIGVPGTWSIGLNDAGTTFVAAAAQSSTVYTVTNWFLPATASLIIKRIGGGTGPFGGVTTLTDNQTIFFADANVLCAKASDQGAFSLSTDTARTFNDISLVNTTMYDIEDQIIQSTGIGRYIISSGESTGTVAATTGNHTSMWYWDGTYWARVFVRANAITGVAGTTHTYIAKASPDNFGVVYMGDTANATIYYTYTNGMADWRWRIAPLLNTTLVDIEVVDDATFYAATNVLGTGYVCPLTYSGQYWNASDYISVFGPGVAIASITLVSDDQVLAGSQAGRVAFTTTGGHTPGEWGSIAPAIVGGTWVYAESTSCAPGSVVYACAANIARVWGYVIGSGAAAWFPVYTSAYFGTGRSIDILIYGAGTAQCIYYLASNNTAGAASTTILARSFLSDALLPGAANGWLATADGPAAFFVPTYDAGVVPDALKGSLDPVLPGNQIWFIDMDGADRWPTPMKGWGDTLGQVDQIVQYTDELAVTVPVLSSPINGYIIQVNRETGIAYDVSLKWAPAAGTAFGFGNQLQISMNTDFTDLKVNVVVATAYPFTIINVGPHAALVAGITIDWQPGEIYYWRVRACLPFYSHWSEVFTLNIQPTPIPVPELYSPTNGGVVTTLTPAFSWSPMSGTAAASGITTTYTFQLATDPTFNATTSLIYTTTATGTTGVELPPGYLIDGSTYYWRVSSTVVPPGDWSATANFKVDLSAGTTTTTTTETSTAVPATVAVPSGSATHTDNVVNPSYIWAIIIIGAVLVIAIIVLIFRTRK